MSNSSRQLLDTAYSRLGFEGGDLLSASDEPTEGTSQEWIDKGDWLALAKKVGAEKLFFVNNYPVVVFAEQTSDNPADWVQWFNSVWCMARPQVLFLARQGELSVFNLTKKPARRGEVPGVTRLLDVVQLTADVQEKLHKYRRDQVESGRLFEDNRFGFEDRADRALVRDLEKVREALLNEGLAPGYAHALIGRSIFIRYLEDRRVLVEKYFRRIAKTDASGRWGELLDEAAKVSGENGLGHPIFYPTVLTNKGFAYALFTKLAEEFNGDMFPVNPEEQRAVTEKHLKLLHRFLLGGKDEKLFFFAYRFDIIPIELISSIYEKFYTLEKKKKKRRDEGSYYTPAALVEFVLSQTLSEDILAKTPRILDPACGSGIFLVEAFRRIVRYRVAQTRRPPTREELRTILRDQLAGADINPEAIRVAAFSLYLAMLHYLNPPDILKYPLPCLTYSIRPGKKPSKDYDILVAENVFRIEETVSESSVKARFTSGCADVVIGNPPWGKAKETDAADSGGEAWCAARGLSVGYRERSETFIHRTMDLLREGGRAGMLVSTGIFFKRHKNTREFREQWLSATTLQKVVNFAAVRDAFFRSGSEDGESKKNGAVAPFAAVVFDKASPPEESRFNYWSAKETAFVKRVQAAILNRADLRVVEQRRFLEDDTLWKIYWWGGHRDEALIRRLSLAPSLRDVLDPKDRMGQGFQKVKNGKLCEWLQKYPECPIKCFVRYGALPVDTFSNPPKYVHRSRREELYKGPRILIKRGVGNDESEAGRIVARYEEADFSFRHSIFSIPLKGISRDDAKATLGVLWSSVVRYYLFLTSGEWGLWHDALQSETIHGIPIRLPKSKTLKRRLVRIVDALRAMQPAVEEGSMFQEEGALPARKREARIRELEAQLDQVVYQAFDLAPEEKERVEELCGLGLGLFYQGMKSPAVEPLDWDPSVPSLGRSTDLDGDLGQTELAQYLKTFLGLWEPHLAGQGGRFRWRLVRPPEASSMTAAIFQTETAENKLADPTTSDDKTWRELLLKLEDTTRQKAAPQRVYIDGLIRVVSDEDIVIIKKTSGGSGRIRRLGTTPKQRWSRPCTCTRRASNVGVVMDRPRLSLAVSRRDFERAVLGVFLDALGRLCLYGHLPAAEPSINLELFQLALAAHLEQYRSGNCTYDFVIDPDSTSKPQPDDAAPDSRLKKRPDFACTMKDMQAVHSSLSQVSYYLECKRLGQQDGEQVFNDLYSEMGIARFMTEEHQYAKGCESAAMIGLVEDMEPETVFSEVNAFAARRSIPSLTKAAAGWVSGAATVLPAVSLRRSFDENPILLHHFWADLRGCKFDVPSDHPPQAAGNAFSLTPTKKPGAPAAPAPPAVTRRPAQRIAILGWGSLLWDRDAVFDAQHGDWQAGGPTLQIEFSRISTSKRPGALTLVIDQVNGSPVTVSWCLSKRGSVAAAQKDLREREGAKADDIKILRVDEPHGPFSSGSVEETIALWAKQNGLTAVVWTGLPSNFGESNSKFTPVSAISYLKGLKAVRKNKAVEYIRNAPAFVQTAFRAAFDADPAFAT